MTQPNKNHPDWPIVVGNWKMQLGVAETVDLSKLMASFCRTPKSPVAVVVCPSSVALSAARSIIDDGPIYLGAQDIFWTDRGAFTGETSPLTLKELGVKYAIIGHSERRALGETDDEVGRKVVAALAHGIRPIVCVGESANDRAHGRQEDVVRHQIGAAFRGAPPPTINQVVYIAYEPIWAISPHDAADPEEADKMRKFIRRILFDYYPAELVESSFVVLYGGSVDPQNVSDYVTPNRFKGALVGKASLNAESFCQLIKTVTGEFPGE